MSPVRATLVQAARWAAASSTAADDWNPVYRALFDGLTPPPESAPEEEILDDESLDNESRDYESLDLVLRQITAPALLVVAVTDGDTTRRLRIGVDPRAATIEAAEGEAASRWAEIPVQEVPAEISSLLADSGITPEPARRTIEQESNGLRLTLQQSRTARAALARGLSPAEAFAAVPDLDDRLRDALTATGPRIAVSLTLHDPQRTVTERPVTWSRLWVSGEHGLYRLDAPTSPDGAIHAVGGGDLLGTVLPVLEEGLRFAAACAAAGERR